MRALLGGLLERQAPRNNDHAHRMTALQNKVADADTRLSRLYQAIENSVAGFADPTLKERVAALKAECDHAKAALDRAFSQLRPETRIAEDRIAAFAGVMRTNVTSGPIPFRRSYLRAIDRPGRGRRRGNPHPRATRRFGASCDGRRGGSGRSAQFCSGVVEIWRARENETGHRYVIVSPIDS
ncbi:MAG: hypothetical protein WDN46_01965 [Methylocella sp.]